MLEAKQISEIEINQNSTPSERGMTVAKSHIKNCEVYLHSTKWPNIAVTGTKVLTNEGQRNPRYNGFKLLPALDNMTDGR